jgi:pyruvate dehydrogenase E2 component (dihydrolipoamide acetyltransferase)
VPFSDALEDLYIPSAAKIDRGCQEPQGVHDVDPHRHHAQVGPVDAGGKVNGWLKQVGDAIEKGDEVLDVETDKIAGASRRRLRRAAPAVAGEEDVLPVGACSAWSPMRGRRRRHRRPSPISRPASSPGRPPRTRGRRPRRSRWAGHAALPEAGEGGEPMVLIHGFGGDLNNWLFNHAALAADREVYALDLPGHGESTKDVGEGSLEALADTVAAAGCGGIDAAHLVGHSMGGAVSLMVAERAPQRVRSLSLIAAPASAPRSTPATSTASSGPPAATR